MCILKNFKLNTLELTYIYKTMPPGIITIAVGNKYNVYLLYNIYIILEYGVSFMYFKFLLSS
jgi:hypothetical protein